MTSGLESPLGRPPRDWNLVHLGDIAVKVGSGATPRGGANVYTPTRTSYALIRSQNVFDRWFETSEVVFVDDEAAGKLASAEVKQGDVLLNITGDGVTFARSCLAPQDVLPACVNQHVSIIRVDPSRCCPGYLLSYLTHPTIKTYIASFNTGASRRAVTKGAIQAFVVPLPPLSTQERIADVLCSYDDLIENNTKRIKILEEMARSLYHEWFVNFRFPGHERSKLVRSPLGSIPESWRTPPVTDEFDICYGKNLPKTAMNEGAAFPVFGAGGIIGRYDQSNIDGPTALITSRGAGSGTVWRTHEPGFVTNNAFTVRPTSQSSVTESGLIATLLEHCPIASVVGGAAQPQLTLEGLRAVHAAIPPRDMGRVFDSQFSPLTRQVDVLTAANDNLRATRDLLLPRLISGEIDVSSLPSGALAPAGQDTRTSS